MKATRVALVIAAAAGCNGINPPPPPPRLPPPPPAASTTTSAAAPTASLPPPPPPVEAPRRTLQLPGTTKLQLPSGMTIALIRRPAAPLASVQLSFASGGIDDRPGVAQMTASLIARGAGANARQPRQFARDVGATAGTLSASVGPRRSSFGLTVPKKQLQSAIDELGAMVARRQLRIARYGEMRARAMDLAGARSRDDPDWLVSELLGRSLMGAGEATSRRATYGTVSELSRIRFVHCGAYYAKRYRAGVATLTVVGDVDLSELESMAVKSFAALAARKGATSQTPTPTLSGSYPLRVYLVNQPKAPHATLSAAITGSAVTAARLPRLDLLRELWAMRSETRIRLIETMGDGAVMTLQRRVALDQAATALSEMLELAKDRSPPSTADLQSARAKIATELAEHLDDVQLLAARSLRLAQLRLADDHDASYVSRLEATTASDIEAVAAGLSDARVVVVVGDSDKLGPQLRSFGEVRIVNPRTGFSSSRTLSAQPSAAKR